MKANICFFKYIYKQKKADSDMKYSLNFPFSVFSFNFQLYDVLI